MSSAPITVIVVFEVPAEAVEQFTSDWRSDKDFMIRQPGCIDGALYRSLQSDARFRFVNIARWESQDDWQTALEVERNTELGKGSTGYRIGLTWASRSSRLPIAKRCATDEQSTA